MNMAVSVPLCFMTVFTPRPIDNETAGTFLLIPTDYRSARFDDWKSAVSVFSNRPSYTELDLHWKVVDAVSTLS